MFQGLICSRCGFMKVYWNTRDLQDGAAAWCKHIEQNMPLGCDNCGQGEMRIKSNIRPNVWCDDCALPKIRCRCKRQHEQELRGKWSDY